MTIVIDDQNFVSTVTSVVGSIDSRHQVILRMFAESEFPTRRFCAKLSHSYACIAGEFSRIAEYSGLNLKEYELDALRTYCQEIAAADWKVINLYFKKPRKVEPEGMCDLLVPMTFIMPAPPPQKPPQYEFPWRSWL